MTTIITERLSTITKGNAPALFSMSGKSRWCRVIDVYDGDTINIVFEEGEELRHHKFRLYGIDTAEMKPLKSTPNREAVVKKAKDAREYLKSLILDKTVFVVFTKEEKYGRLMGDVYTDESRSVHINKTMVSQGYAGYYDGGKKQSEQ